MKHFKGFKLHHALLLAFPALLTAGCVVAPAPAVLAVAPPVAGALVIPVHLTGSEEAPPVNSPGSANGQIVVDPVSHAISGGVMPAGFEPTMAHIHLGAPGSNGPVMIPLQKNPDGSFSIPAGSVLAPDQYAALIAGNLYINMHSPAHPGGEIRAQLRVH